MNVVKPADVAVAPNAQQQPPVEQQPSRWNDGVCGCCSDFGICCQSICCHPCTASNVINRRDTGSMGFSCLTCIGYLCATYLSGGRAVLCVGFALRRELIQRYMIIEETACRAFCLTCCCHGCSFCQVQREMLFRHEPAGGCCSNPPSNEPSMSDKVSMAAASFLKPSRTWGSGICGCGCCECIEALCCQCCVHGYVYGRLNQNASWGPLPPNFDAASCCGSLCLMDGWTYANRREVMERYNITGESHLMSVLLVCCCEPCAVLQQRREMGYNGEWPGGLCVKEAPPLKQ